ncbi:MAG TPA: undecaprenyldiphospho-muramoylpentapeptide beta-N-acetylglucosaminyltransferase [Terriglobia bacterium]|nr:undecaprenyldiphospho-muramoylpentapeptide beta-N-acetylglucosaminyltransferase [Terriglobia bacterium]
MRKSQNQLRVLIAGGGTGGHIYPGIAIAKELQRRHPHSQFLFVGTERGLESRIVPNEGFRLERITVAGLKGMGGLRQLTNSMAIPKSLWESCRILRRFRPSVVIGVGGYSSGPPVLMAVLMGIPAMLQEQNALPGLTNRLLGQFVRRVAAGFQEATAYFGSKTVVTGNPVRSGFSKIQQPQESARFTLLISGGSRGSQAINQAVVDALQIMTPNLEKLHWIHQTGEQDHKMVLQAYQGAGASADVRPFFNDMPEQFAKAHLLICRSGATTLAEITVAGKAALLVPFPQAADDHQRKNAEALVRAGAAEMLLQKDLDGSRLADRIQYFFQNRDVLSRMENSSRGLGRPDATERIADLIEELGERKSQLSTK